MTQLISSFFQKEVRSEEHDGLTDSFWCPVAGCGRDFVTANARAIHIKWKHPQEKTPARSLNEPTTRRRRMSYDQKADILEKLEEGYGVCDLHRATGIPTSTISDLKRNKGKIRENLEKGFGKRKMVGGGRKPFFPALLLLYPKN